RFAEEDNASHADRPTVGTRRLPYTSALTSQRDTLFASTQMAGFRRRTPLGSFDEPPHPEGIAPGAGYEIPGPLGLYSAGKTPGQRDDPWRGTSADQEIGQADGVRLTLGAETYCLRRADLRGSWPPGEEAVPAKEAEAVLGRAVRQIGAGSQLSDL